MTTESAQVRTVLFHTPQFWCTASSVDGQVTSFIGGPSDKMYSLLMFVDPKYQCTPVELVVRSIRNRLLSSVMCVLTSNTFPYPRMNGMLAAKLAENVTDSVMERVMVHEMPDRCNILVLKNERRFMTATHDE